MSEVRIENGKIVACISGFANRGPRDGYYKLIPVEESKLAKMEKMDFVDPEEVLRDLGLED